MGTCRPYYSIRPLTNKTTELHKGFLVSKKIPYTKY